MAGAGDGMGCIRKLFSGDSPGRPVAKNPPCKAGDVCSIRGWGTKTHASEQLSMCTTTRESVPQRPHMMRNLRPDAANKIFLKRKNNFFNKIEKALTK